MPGQLLKKWESRLILHWLVEKSQIGHCDIEKASYLKFLGSKLDSSLVILAYR